MMVIVGAMLAGSWWPDGCFTMYWQRRIREGDIAKYPQSSTQHCRSTFILYAGNWRLHFVEYTPVTMSKL